MNQAGQLRGDLRQPSAAERACNASCSVSLLTVGTVTTAEVIDPVPCAASVTPRDVSPVVAVCSSTALAMPVPARRGVPSSEGTPRRGCAVGRRALPAA